MVQVFFVRRKDELSRAYGSRIEATAYARTCGGTVIDVTLPSWVFADPLATSFDLRETLDPLPPPELLQRMPEAS